MNKASKVYEILRETYPDAKCGLDYATPFQLLVSTMLSAQATDKSVNKVTAEMYACYPDLDSFLTLTQEELEQKIKKIGLYKNKAKNIYSMCRVLKEKYSGHVPTNMDDLISLPGVGRKTASVVLVEAFNIPAFPVDTHVYRVTRRIGLAEGSTADKVSDEMMKKLPKYKWHLTHHLFITHGRETCIAQNPRCSDCAVRDLCNYYRKEFKAKAL
ncbi:MAG: endonuclease III [Sedimentibacter sp.]|uniref:endonuclease III n=1 Tax=Sedimentibacter sp. TaxID=1960295 RepID=UPI00315887D5